MPTSKTEARPNGCQPQQSTGRPARVYIIAAHAKLMRLVLVLHFGPGPPFYSPLAGGGDPATCGAGVWAPCRMALTHRLPYMRKMPVTRHFGFVCTLLILLYNCRAESEDLQVEFMHSMYTTARHIALDALSKASATVAFCQIDENGDEELYCYLWEHSVIASMGKTSASRKFVA